MKRAHILVGGNIQGVSFRAFVQRSARSLNINGWTKNLLDGRVEIIAEGSEGAIMKFVEIIKEGPPGAKVDDMEMEWDEPTNEFTDFTIIR